MTLRDDRSTGGMDHPSDHTFADSNPVHDAAVESLLRARAREFAHRPGLAERLHTATSTPRSLPFATRHSPRFARLAMAASVVIAAGASVYFMRPRVDAPVIALAQPEAEPVLISLLAGSDEAALDNHPFASDLRSRDSDWTDLAGEVDRVIAMARVHP